LCAFVSWNSGTYNNGGRPGYLVPIEVRTNRDYNALADGPKRLP
jgi:hypothetical protein